MASRYSLDFEAGSSSGESQTDSSSAIIKPNAPLSERQISEVKKLIDEKLGLYGLAAARPCSAPLSASGLVLQLDALNGCATETARAAIAEVERALSGGEPSEQRERAAQRLLPVLALANSARKRLLAALAHLSEGMKEDIAEMGRAAWAGSAEVAGMGTGERLKYLNFEFSQVESEIAVFGRTLREQTGVVLEMVMAEIKKACDEERITEKGPNAEPPSPQPGTTFAEYVAEEKRFKAKFESVLKTKFAALNGPPSAPAPAALPLSLCGDVLAAHSDAFVCASFAPGPAAADCRRAFRKTLRGRARAALRFGGGPGSLRHRAAAVLSGEASLSEPAAEADAALAALGSEKAVLACFLFAAPALAAAPSAGAVEALRKGPFSRDPGAFEARAEGQAALLGRLAARGEAGGALKRFAWRLLALVVNGGAAETFGGKLGRAVFEGWEDASNGFEDEGKNSQRQFEKLKLALFSDSGNS